MIHNILLQHNYLPLALLKASAILLRMVFMYMSCEISRHQMTHIYYCLLNEVAPIVYMYICIYHALSIVDLTNIFLKGDSHEKVQECMGYVVILLCIILVTGVCLYEDYSIQDYTLSIVTC
ncbi:hypothetical protein ACJX0J_012719, partial [Zea mays]